MPFTGVDAAVVAAAALYLAFHLKAMHKGSLPLPPGPPRWPIVGSLFSMPGENETRERFAEWKEKYGDVVHARVLNQDLIIVNTREAAVELLENRSAKYSDRPRLVMGGELVGWVDSLAIMRYGEKHKLTRKLFNEGLGAKAIEELGYLLEQEATKFVQRLLETPEALDLHIRQTAGATLLKVIYGYSVQDLHDPMLVLAKEAVDGFSVATTPGMWLVDTIPWLSYLPWAPFKSRAKEWRALTMDLVNRPFNYTVDKMAQGRHEPSLLARWLERADEQSTSRSAEETDLIKWAATSIYGGGSDTTVSAILTFFVAMIHNPRAQSSAQAEIDRVVGSDRLPTLSDRASLPYVEALYKEVMRWQPVAPFAVPHRYNMESDDEYRGMRIPRGSLIIPNIALMSRNPEVYHDPHQFKPERFLATTQRDVELDPANMMFGFGRRRCPGIHLAHASVWLSIATTLAVYDIKPTKGPDGQPIMPSLKYSQTTISDSLLGTLRLSAMRYIDKAGFTLSVWISDSNEASLLEYGTEPLRALNMYHWTGKPTTESGVSCWIPSVEGEEFSINWQVQLPGSEDESEESPVGERDLADHPMLQGIRCSVWLDGMRVSAGILKVDDILQEVIATLSGESAESESGELQEQRYVFDDSDGIQPGEEESLNHIQIGMQWGRAELGGLPQTESNSVHAFARLGPPTPCDFVGENYNFKPARRPTVWFSFFHASAGWLRAEGIASPLPLIDLTLDSADECSDSKEGIRAESPPPAFEPDTIGHIDADPPTRTTTPIRAPSLKATGIPSPNPPPRSLSRDTAPRLSPRNNTDTATLKRARSKEIIDVDALSDSELQLDTQRDSKVNLVDSKPSTPVGIRTRYFTGKITRRGPRPGSGPHKRAKLEEGVEIKLEETSGRVDGEHEAGEIRPCTEEVKLDTELKQEDES